MRRRAFIGLVGGAAVWPIAGQSEQIQSKRRIGILAGFPENDPEIKLRLAAFREGLEKLGWPNDKLQTDLRHAPGGAQVQQRAQELLAFQPDVIFANSTPMAAAVRKETRTVPIVFVAVSDPIGSGFVASLARPGGNMTGLLLYEEGIAGKWLAMLREVAPQVERIALLANARTTPYEYFLRSAQQSAASLGVEIVPARVENAATIEHALEALASKPNGGLIVPSDSTVAANRDLVIALAARLRLPAIYALRLYVTAGGLVSYGTDRVDEFRRAAYYVDRILRGEAPGDLPVQAPTRFQTAVNLKTAKALGLTIPPTLTALADEVVE